MNKIFILKYSVLITLLFLNIFSLLFSQTHAPVIITNGSSITLPGGDIIPYVNSGTYGYAISAQNSGSIITVTGGGGIIAYSTNLTQTGVVYASSGGYIDLGTGSQIRGEGYNPATNWAGAVGLATQDNNSKIIARDITIEAQSDHPYGAYALNNGTITLTGQTNITIKNAVNSNKTSFALSANNGGTITTEDVTIIIDGVSNQYSTYAYAINTFANGSSTKQTSTTIDGHVNVNITGQAARGVNTVGSSSQGAASKTSLKSISGTLMATGTSGDAYAVWANNSGIVDVTDDIHLTATANSWSIGLFSQNAGQITASNSGLSEWNITSNLGSAAGIWATGNNSSVTMSGQSQWEIKALGNTGTVYGIRANSGTTVTLAGDSTWTLSHPHNTAAALYVIGGAINQTGRMTFNLTGKDVRGVYASGTNSAIQAEHVDLTVTGSDNAVALYATGATNSNPININFSDSLLKSNKRGIIVDDGHATINFTRTTLINDEGIAFNLSASTLGATHLTLNSDQSRFTGAAITDSLSTFDLFLENSSYWTISASSNLTNLTNNQSTIIISPPTHGFFKTLTVNNYTGMNGNLILNTFLGDDHAPSDRLIIDGGIATGSTSLLINNAGGSGALTTGDGILVVEAINGATTGVNSFSLGQRVAAGAYEYTLMRGGLMNPENWYLTSFTAPIIPPQPPVPPVQPPIPPAINPSTSQPNYRIEVALASALTPLAIEYDFNILDTLHERVSETQHQIVSNTWFNGVWSRIIGQHGARNNQLFTKYGANYDYNLSAMQIGMNIFNHQNAAMDINAAGIYFATGQMNANVRTAQDQGKAGSIHLDAQTFGGYWTHYSSKKWYTDMVIQGTWYGGKVRSVKNEQFSPNAFGFSASLEGGYTFHLGNNIFVEPQAQLIYQKVSFDNFIDSFGIFNINNTDSLRGRLGVRIKKDWALPDGIITTWIRGNIWHEFKNKNSFSISNLFKQNSVLLSSSLQGTWGDVSMGVSGRISKNITIFGSANYHHSLGHYNHNEWGAHVGLTYQW